MNKIVASVGMVVFSALSLSASSLSDLASSASRPWSASLTLRGFWDDNVNGVPSGSAGKSDIYGVEVSPSVGIAWADPQTKVTANFIYSIKYYDKDIPNTSDHYDQTFSFDILLDHRFSEIWHGSVRDSFVVGQEPDFLRAGVTYNTFQRISGDNIRNYGTLNVDGQLTPTLGIAAGYDNTLFHYSDENVTIVPGGFPTPSTPSTGILETVIPSRSGELDSIEQVVHVDGRWTIQPTTVGVLGIQGSFVDYTADQPLSRPILLDGTPLQGINSQDRNSWSIYGYVGADHTFRPDLTGSVRAGARYTDFYNDPSKTTIVSPYARAVLDYLFHPQSTFELGFSYDRNATDLVSFDFTKSSHFTTDAESASLWASLAYAFTPKLIGTVMGEFQNSVYNGGYLDSASEDFYTVGVNLAYHFNQHFSTEVGYNYDKLDSDSKIGRSFDRNRAYIGGTATW